MVVGVDTDILDPYHQQEHISRNIGNLLAMAKVVSPIGHDAFLAESRQEVSQDAVHLARLSQEGLDLGPMYVGDEYYI